MPILVWLRVTVPYPRSRSILTERMELDAHLHVCTHMHTLTHPLLLAPRGETVERLESINEELRNSNRCLPTKSPGTRRGKK